MPDPVGKDATERGILEALHGSKRQNRVGFQTIRVFLQLNFKVLQAVSRAGVLK